MKSLQHSTSKKKKLKVAKKARIRTHHRFLRRLYETSSRGKRKAYRETVQHASPQEVKTVCEVAQNLLDGVYPPLTPKKHREMSVFKGVLRKLRHREVPLEEKRKIILNQHGGFITALLAPVVGTLLSSLLQ